jgi:hypothetical protein
MRAARPAVATRLRSALPVKLAQTIGERLIGAELRLPK